MRWRVEGQVTLGLLTLARVRKSGSCGARFGAGLGHEERAQTAGEGTIGTVGMHYIIP